MRPNRTHIKAEEIKYNSSEKVWITGFAHLVLVGNEREVGRWI